MVKKAAKGRMLKAAVLVLFASVALFTLTETAFATAKDTLPWGEGLDQLRASLTGSVAGVVSLIAIVGAGAMLLFGGNIQGFMRTMVYIILVIGVVVGANNLLTAFYSYASVNLPSAEIQR